MSPQFVEAVKEFLRTGLLAFIAVVIANLSAGQPIDLSSAGLAAAVAVLRGIDKYLHEIGKQMPQDFRALDALKG